MKNLKKLMSLLLALLMLAGNMTTALATDIVAAGVVHPSELIQTYAIDRSNNLTDFVKRVRIFDKDGKDVTDSSVLYDGVDYTFRVEFEENGTTLQYGVDADGKMHYKLPTGFTYKGEGQFPAKDADGRTVGMFEISGSEVTFTPWYYNKEDEKFYQQPKKEGDKLFNDQYSNATLWCELHGTVTRKGDKQVIDFGNEVKKEFTVEQEQKKPYADVEKTADNNTLYVDADGRKYFLTTITATIKDGDPTELNIIDTINWLHKEYIGNPDQDSFTVSQIRGGASTPLIGIEPTWKSGSDGITTGFELKLDSNNVEGGLKENDQYVITYKTYLTDAGTNYIKPDDDWCELNSVKTKIGDKEKESSWQYIIKGKPRIISKTSSGMDANDPTLVNWRIEIGDSLGTDIAGKTITDVWNEHLENGQNAKLDGISMVDDSRRIQITVRKADGSTATIDVPASEVGSYFTPTTDNGKQTGFEFEVPNAPAGSEYEGAKVIKCVVDYQTKATTKNEHGTFKIDNKAQYEDGRSGDASGDGGVSGLDDFEIEKTFEGDDGDKLKFKVRILIPSAARNQQIYVSDWTYLNGWDWSNNSLSLDMSDINITATDGENTYIFTEGRGDYTYAHAAPEAGHQFFFNLPDGYTLSSSHDDNKKNSIWKWESDKDVTMTIEYSLKKPTEFRGSPVSTGIVYNKAYIELGDKKKGDQADAPFGKQARIDKEAKLNSDGTIDYIVTINGNFTAKIPTNAEFVDTFDKEHLEFKEGSLKVEYIYKNNWGGVSIAANPTYTSDSLGQNGQIRIVFDEFGQGGWQAGSTSDGLWNFGIYSWEEYANLTNWYQREYIVKQGYWDNVNIVSHGVYYAGVRLKYKLKIKNVQPGVSYNLRNEAKIEGYDDATANVPYKVTLLDKSVGQINGATLPYTITVNPSGTKLLPGTGNLRLIDTMSEKLVPLLQTLKVYKKEGNDLTELTHGTGEGQWMYFYDSTTNTLELSLPDSTSLVIKYDAMVQGDANDRVYVKNTAKLVGFTESSTKENTFTIGSASGGAGGTTYKLVLFKTAEESGTALAGATFEVDWVLPNTQKWERFHSFTTEENGMVELTHGSGGEAVHANELYRITEVSAPEGYKRRTEPIYIYIKSTQEPKEPDDIRAQTIARLTDEAEIAKVQNAKILGIVNSEMVPIPNEPIGGIEFYKASAEDATQMLGGAEFTLTSEKDSTWVKTATSNLKGAVSFPNVPTGTYKLVETKAPNGYMCSSGYWLVTVTEENNVRTVSYVAMDGAREITSNNGKFVLTNAEIPDLPSVGGSGTLAYSLFGLALMAMAAAAAYALAEKRRRIER